MKRETNSSVSRRDLLGILATGILLLARPVRALAETCRQLLATDAGPFYPIEPIPYAENLVTGAMPNGTILYLSGRLIDESCRPVAGADVEIWQCDAGGQYKHPMAPKTKPLESSFLYFAKARSAADGAFKFRTLRPVPYTAFGIKRAPHVHIRVKAAGRPVVTTELYFRGHEDDKLRLVDRVFQGRGERRDELVVDLKPVVDKPGDGKRGAEPGALSCEYEVVVNSR